MAEKENIPCFYCGAFTHIGNLEYDHFPIPQDCDGLTMVPACVSCHSMKDRFGIDSWPEDWIGKIVKDMANFDRETKIWLAKVMADLQRFQMQYREILKE